MVGKVLNTLVWLGTQQECKRNIRELNQKTRRFIISENNRKSKGC